MAMRVDGGDMRVETAAERWRGSCLERRGLRLH